jgi:phosphoribosylanthranilate isomerase
MKVKFCGFTRIEDIKFALSINVDYIGIVLFEKSKRFVPLNRLEIITKTIKEGKYIGVFVNEEIDNVQEIYFKYNLTFTQLHGDENNEYVETLIKKGVNVIKAFRVKDTKILEEIKETPAKFILLDTFKEDEYGGTGRRINEEILNYLLNNIKNKKIFLSGGINKDNIGEILNKFGRRIHGVDISSGIETTHGIKDHLLMGEIMNKIKMFNNSIL